MVRLKSNEFNSNLLIENKLAEDFLIYDSNGEYYCWKSVHGLHKYMINTYIYHVLIKLILGEDHLKKFKLFH